MESGHCWPYGLVPLSLALYKCRLMISQVSFSGSLAASNVPNGHYLNSAGTRQGKIGQCPAHRRRVVPKFICFTHHQSKLLPQNTLKKMLRVKTHCEEAFVVGLGSAVSLCNHCCQVFESFLRYKPPSETLLRLVVRQHRYLGHFGRVTTTGAWVPLQQST